MANKLSQSNRVAEFKTPLGENVLTLVNIEGTEALGDMALHLRAEDELHRSRGRD